MTYSHRLFASTALAAALSAAPAVADVTAQQVWDDLENYFTGFGYTVTATETATGSGVSVTDLVLSFTDAETDTTVSMTMDELLLTDTGDGSVVLDFPASIPLSLDLGDEDVRMVFDYALTDLAVTVSGTATDMTYDYSGPRLSIALVEAMEKGVPIGRDKLAINLVMEGVSGTSTMKVGTLREIAQSMKMDGVRYTLSFDEIDGPGTGKAAISGSMANLEFDGSGAFPMQTDTTDLAAMIRAGFGFGGTFAYADGSFSLSGEEEGETFNVAGSSATADITVELSQDGLAYAASGTGTKISMMGGEIPFPVQMEAEETGVRMRMPVAAGDAEQDFELGMVLGRFTMADMLWNIFDPGQVLPRDPATVALEARGKMKLFVDLLDEKAMMAAGSSDQVPGELNSLTLSNITVDVAGARLTGTGDFTFDNSDLETFDGFPRPIGGVDLKIVGANTLIDNLIRMGIVTEEDAMGARMMMSMFGVPGDEPDTLNSKLEINGQGHVLANGMRIQ